MTKSAADEKTINIAVNTDLGCSMMYYDTEETGYLRITHRLPQPDQHLFGATWYAFVDKGFIVCSRDRAGQLEDHYQAWMEQKKWLDFQQQTSGAVRH